MLVKCNEIHDITYSKGGGTIKSCGDRLFCKLVWLHDSVLGGSGGVYFHCLSTKYVFYFAFIYTGDMGPLSLHFWF